MPGGKWHAPVWSPYAIYSTVDLVYGFPAWEDKNGFTAAQATLNVVESAVYLAYLYIVAVHGKEDTKTPGRGAWSSSWWGKARVLGGQAAGAACLMGLSGSLMTMSKTMLYGKSAHVPALAYAICTCGAMSSIQTILADCSSAKRVLL